MIHLHVIGNQVIYLRRGDEGEALVKARPAYLETKAYDEAMFGQDFGVE